MDMQMGVEEFRKELGPWVDAAYHRSEVTTVTKGNNRTPYAVLVPYEWYREAEARRLEMVKEQRSRR